MKIYFIYIVIALSALPFSCAQKESKVQENSIVGTWQLTSWQAIADSTVQCPYGEDAIGTLIYTEDGEVSLTLAYNNRDTLASDDRSKIDAESAKKAYTTYFAYTGKYELDKENKKVIHNIEISLLPNWQGTQQIRNYQLHNDVLVLSADVVLGKYHLLEWKRKKSV
jgi:hypothetical protein